MAEITSLESCFSYHTEYPKVRKLIQDLIDRVKSEAKELEKNDIYYGNKTFSVGEYVPINFKMDTINKNISQLCTSLIDAKKELKKAFYTKNKEDLHNYINYIDANFLTKNENGYNRYKRAEYYYNRDNSKKDLLKEMQLYRVKYFTYKEYLPYRKRAEQKLQELERIYNSTAEG